MSLQFVRAEASVLDNAVLDNFDIGVVTDAFGVPTGELRLGDGELQGGFTVSGIVGSPSGVSSINGQTGVVNLTLDDLTDVNCPAPDDGFFLGFAGGAWGCATPRMFGLADTALTGISDGQGIQWSTSVNAFVPVTLATGTTGTGGSDDLGNHTATQNLEMAGFNIRGVPQVQFDRGFLINNDNQNSIQFRRDSSAFMSFFHNGVVGEGFMALADYGSLRASDVGVLGQPDNFASFAGNGLMRRVALSEMSVGLFSDVDLSDTTLGHVLTRTSSGLEMLAPSGTGTAPTTIDALLDTDIGTPVDGQFLGWNAGASAWQNLPIPAPSVSFADLTEVSGTPVGDGFGVFYDLATTSWVVRQPDTKILSEITDIDLTGLKDGDVLQYDQGTGSWLAKSLLGSSLTLPLAQGTLLYVDAAGDLVALPPAADGTSLQMSGGVPAWI